MLNEFDYKSNKPLEMTVVATYLACLRVAHEYQFNNKSEIEFLEDGVGCKIMCSDKPFTWARAIIIVVSHKLNSPIEFGDGNMHITFGGELH